ncbi:MAG: pyruvate synthase [Candidatus Brocadiales bacterium]
MVKEMLTGNAAAAWGARLAEVDYVPSFPITPQTEIIETISQWVSKEEMGARFVMMDSEHSMLAAAGTAAATGVRVFTASSSQGLLYGFEMLYTISGWRVPLVLVNTARALSAPITLEPDHNDILAARDSGFLQIHAENCQEVLDFILMGYKISEDERVLLPVIVNLDGFYLSFTREPVEIPALEQARQFLPPFNAKHTFFKASRPISQGSAVLGGSGYSFFKYQMHLAACNGIPVYKEVAKDFERIFGRSYGTIEPYEMDDAEYVIIMSNCFATKGKAAVHIMREKGHKVGLLKLRLIRPFPVADIMEALNGLKGVAVIDQNIAPGSGGILYNEICGALYNQHERPDVLLSFIGGLGGKDISQVEFEYVVETTMESAKTGVVPEPILLFTNTDLELTERLINIAGNTKRSLENIPEEQLQTANRHST